MLLLIGTSHSYSCGYGYSIHSTVGYSIHLTVGFSIHLTVGYSIHLQTAKARVTYVRQTSILSHSVTTPQNTNSNILKVETKPQNPELQLRTRPPVTSLVALTPFIHSNMHLECSNRELSHAHRGSSMHPVTVQFIALCAHVCVCVRACACVCMQTITRLLRESAPGQRMRGNKDSVSVSVSA
jgi:hypothetical protein